MFIACACTGLVAILLDVNPYLGRGWAVPLAWGFWWLGAVQFLVFASLLLARQVDLGGKGWIVCSALSGMSGAVADPGAACTQCCRWCRLRARSRLHCALPRNRIFFYWESIASLPKSKRLDMLFLCATAIGAAITSEGMSRYMIHYFGHGFQMVAYILFVS